MFKALLAASVAMLACCAAAVLAGPTPPLPSAEAPVSASPSGDQPLPIHLVSPFEAESDSLHYHVSPNFMPIPLSTAFAGGSPSTVEDDATSFAPPPPVQAAVIPLPSPLYAALALLGVALIARRAMLRAC